MKNTAIPLIGVCCLLLAGCTGSFAKVRTAIDQALEWYDARRVEIRGEGYPKIIDVPVIAENQAPGLTLEASKARGAELRAVFAEMRERLSPRIPLPRSRTFGKPSGADLRALRPTLNS